MTSPGSSDEGASGRPAAAFQPTVSQVEIREALAADAPAIAAVFLASRSVTLPYLPRLHTDVETQTWIAEVMLPRCATWVAVDRATGAVVGFAALEGGSLEHLYLRPDLRRQGIGSALLEQVGRLSPDGLSLWVFQRNTAARAFYQQHGFREVRATDGRDNEEHEPDLLYTRP